MKKIRIYGDVLGEQDTFIDCTIDEITLDRIVYLTDTDDGQRTWEIHLNKLHEHIDNYTVVKHSELPDPDHEIWNRLSGVRSELDQEPFASSDTNFDVVVRNIFVSVIRAIRESNDS